MPRSSMYSSAWMLFSRSLVCPILSDTAAGSPNTVPVPKFAFDGGGPEDEPPPPPPPPPPNVAKPIAAIAAAIAAMSAKPI